MQLPDVHLSKKRAGMRIIFGPIHDAHDILLFNNNFVHMCIVCRAPKGDSIITRRVYQRIL